MKLNKSSTIHKQNSVSSNKKNDTQNKDREELKAYIYRGLHICFCQGRDKNAKQKNYVDNWTDSIMERVETHTKKKVEEERKRCCDLVEKAKLPYPNPYGKFVRVERVNNNILEPLKLSIQKESK
jgi:hypothetical protein